MNLVANPEFTGGGLLPDNWDTSAPREELMPGFGVVRAGAGNKLEIRGNGDVHAMGCYWSPLALEQGKWYHAKVCAETENIDEPLYSLAAHAAGSFLSISGTGPNSFIFKKRFQAIGPGALNADKFQLFLRCSPRGRVLWSAPSVTEIPPPELRKARIGASMLMHVDATGDPVEDMAANRRRIADNLDTAGGLKCDLILLPECCQTIGVGYTENESVEKTSETVPGGPVSSILSEKARQYGMYVAAGIYERRGKHIFNTLVIYDRSGQIMGRYDKTHPTFYEAEWGISCGLEYPVFEFDFGKAGASICYDQCFPEINRYYAYKGADLILHSVMGSYIPSWQSDANANGVYFAGSIWNREGRRSMIIDSDGAILSEVSRDGVAYADLTFPANRVYFYNNPSAYYGWPAIHHEMRYCANGDMLREYASMLLGEHKL